MISMRRIYKNFLAGFGRALGYIAAIALLSFVLNILNLSVNTDNFPPSIEGEIVATFMDMDDSQRAGHDPYHN